MKPGDVDDPKAGLVEHVGNIKNLTVLDEKWSSLAFCFAKELIHYELRVSLDSSGRVDYVYSDQIESLVQIAVRFLFETAYRGRELSWGKHASMDFSIIRERRSTSLPHIVE